MVSSSLVAPYAGAWIETFSTCSTLGLSSVAPYAGAWIETLMGLIVSLRLSSRPLCRGVD